jgi:hypothetical protein
MKRYYSEFCSVRHLPLYQAASRVSSPPFPGGLFFIFTLIHKNYAAKNLVLAFFS